LTARQMDGLVIGGGVDLDPALYGGEPGKMAEEIGRSADRTKRPVLGRLLVPFVYLLRRMLSSRNAVLIDRARDKLEAALISEVLAQKKPVLGICRGAQMLNAVLGGSLHQEIEGFYVETPYLRSVLPRKRIRVTPASRLASLWPDGTYWVNSLNHQAVDRIAAPLRIAAREENGLVQAVEDPSASFVIGVQWHPEYLPHMRSHQRLFRELVKCAGTGIKRTKRFLRG
jgi:putative glutamine amidotransferase